MTFRRVLILADESADWIVAGLRQLERIALSIDEAAVDNNETSPVSVCICWRSDLDKSQRWVPDNPRLTHLAFTMELDGQPYDLVLSTRLFLYRKAIPRLIERIPPPAAPLPPSWENYLGFTHITPPSCPGAWEYISNGEQIDDIEKRFLRSSGKSQDGFVSRYLNRPISREITRLLLRFSATPDAWTWLIFPIPIVAAVILRQGNYWSFVWGMIFFQVFSVLDGCDGEIARAKFMESERGRQLDDLFDVMSNVLLALGLGPGLFHATGSRSWFWILEGIATALLIAGNEWYLSTRKPAAAPAEAKTDSLGEILYPRHRELVERSGLLALGKERASMLMQLTKRDVAVLFFVFLAAIGLPSLILHLLFVVTAGSLVLALKSRL